ncbi:MAG: hypothetical protein J6U84_02535 [Bacteroidales bacterium]|nr:hypothetical protein [Bacteroidales bacterium]
MNYLLEKMDFLLGKMKESFEKDSVPCGGIGIPQKENGIPSRGIGWNSLKMETSSKKEIL